MGPHNICTTLHLDLTPSSTTYWPSPAKTNTFIMGGDGKETFFSPHSPGWNKPVSTAFGRAAVVSQQHREIKAAQWSVTFIVVYF